MDNFPVLFFSYGLLGFTFLERIPVALTSLSFQGLVFSCPKTDQQNLERRKQRIIKIDLVRNIAEKMNIHTKDAETFLTTFADIVGDCLASGELVGLSGVRCLETRRSIAAQEPKMSAGKDPILPNLTCKEVSS